jgi:hypothetical protein
MSDDPLSDRKRKNEEEYFQRKDRELVEKLRQQALAEKQLRELGQSIGVTDPTISHELAELGFTLETVKLLPLVPVLEMAWAGGGVTPEERKMVIELARARGIEQESTADHQLQGWLDLRPDDSMFRRAGRLISALLTSGGRIQLTADDLLKQCEAIADASGGLFGIGRVSADERATLERIAAEIKSRQP